MVFIKNLETITFYSTISIIFIVVIFSYSAWWFLGRLGQSCLEEINSKWPYMSMGAFNPSSSSPFGTLGPIVLIVALFFNIKGRWGKLHSFLTGFTNAFRKELNQVHKEMKKRSGWDT